MVVDFAILEPWKVSNPNVLDILVFYHESDCMRHDDDLRRADGSAQFPYLDVNGIPNLPDDMEIDSEEYRNLTTSQVHGVEGKLGHNVPKIIF